LSPLRSLLDGLDLVWALAEKDLRIELRSRQAFFTTLFFSFLILMVFNFAFDPASPATRKAAPGILWVALIFPGVIQLNRSFQSEREEGTLLGVLLSPMDRGLIFLGKFLANWIFLLVVDLLTLVIFMAVYNFSLTSATLWMLLLILLSSLGFSAVGTLFGAMVSNLRTREVLLPILLFPIVIPVILAAVNGSTEVLLGENFRFLFGWIKILIAFDVIFLAASYLVFEYVVEES
jgi:heme exporter protein B